MSACVSGTGVITHNSKQHGVDGRRHAVVLRHWRWVADDEARNFRPMMRGGKKLRVQPKTTRVVSWCILFYSIFGQGRRNGSPYSTVDGGAWRQLSLVWPAMVSGGHYHRRVVPPTPRRTYLVYLMLRVESLLFAQTKERKEEVDRALTR